MTIRLGQKLKRIFAVFVKGTELHVEQWKEDSISWRDQVSSVIHVLKHNKHFITTTAQDWRMVGAGLAHGCSRVGAWLEQGWRMVGAGLVQ